MGYLQTFEINLKQNKKVKSVAVQAEVQSHIDEDDFDDKEYLTETLSFLTENFNEIQKELNGKNKSSNSEKSNTFHKGKAIANSFDAKKKCKEMQCWKCEDFRHIQIECANTINKISKAITSMEKGLKNRYFYQYFCGNLRILEGKISANFP